MEGIHFPEHDFYLEPGDGFVVYTDGVSEATDSDNTLFGTDRLLEALNKDPDADPKLLHNNVKEAIALFMGDAQQFDDITMLCFQYKGP